VTQYQELSGNKNFLLIKLQLVCKNLTENVFVIPTMTLLYWGARSRGLTKNPVKENAPEPTDIVTKIIHQTQFVKYPRTKRVDP
jgi:hypothetical protein